MPNRSDSRTVYTTESGRICPDCGRPVAECRCGSKTAPRPQGDGIVRVSLERKGRGGKTVTVVSGLRGSEADLKTIAAELKRRCGTGGTLKDGLVEIQGDHRDTLVAVLKAKGMQVKKVGG